MENLFEAMDIAEDQKIALQENFDKAVLKKTTEMLDEHVETLVTEKVEVLEEEYKEKVTLLEDSLDGYLDTVVEEFISENAPEYEAQIAEEKTKTLLSLFDKMVEVVGVDMLQIQESKDLRETEDYAKTAEAQVSVLESKIADMADRLVDSRREADLYLQTGLVKDLSEGLSILESAKFEKLTSLIPFERASSYITKLELVKESIIEQRAEDFSLDSTIELPKTAFKKDGKVDAAAAMDWSKYA